MFFNNFQLLCSKRNVSPSKVVTDIGMNKSAVTYWKNSGAVPKGETLQKIAEYFNVSVEYLINGTEHSTPQSPITFDDFTYAMYNHSTELTEEEKKMLLEMAEFMKKKRGL